MARIYSKSSAAKSINEAGLSEFGIPAAVPEQSGDSFLTTTASIFRDGDPVTINLGYNGDLRQEFMGFVRTRDLNMPLTIECEGYSYQLRLKQSISHYYPSTTVKGLLEAATKGTDVTVICDVDITLQKIKLVNASASKIIDFIHEVTDHNLCIFFISPTVLWCGLAFTEYANGNNPFPQTGFNLSNGDTASIAYRLGYNTVKDNRLRMRLPSEPVQILYHGKLATGDVVITESKGKYHQTKIRHMLNNLQSSATLQELAQEKEYRKNYSGYEGEINGFLQPYCQPGYKVTVKDSRYKERDGDYLATAINVDFGVNGAKRSVTLGPRIGFDI